MGKKEVGSKGSFLRAKRDIEFLGFHIPVFLGLDIKKRRRRRRRRQEGAAFNTVDARSGVEFFSVVQQRLFPRFGDLERRRRRRVELHDAPIFCRGETLGKLGAERR